MLNVPNSKTIFSLLYILVAFISRRKAKGVVAGSIGVKYPNIKICIQALLQKPLVLISKRASLVVLADAREKSLK